MSSTRTREISNGDDIIDSRDVIARIAELEEEREPLTDALHEAETLLQNTIEEGDADEDREARAEAVTAAREALDEWDTDNADELKALKDLEEEASGYAADWRYGEALIRDSYFEEYARELADDIGAVKSDAGWPNSYIDWKAAAEALQQDYTSVEFDGVTYWIR